MGRNKLSNFRNVVMFGLGVQFQDCYGQLVLSFGQDPDFLCDNARKKWGKQFFGKTCIPPAELGRFAGDNTAVIITVRKYEDIYRQLSEMGLKNIFVACFDQGHDVVYSIKKLCTEQSTRAEKPFESPVRGKWTLVTGASRGIGRQIALAMAEQGSNIIAHSRQLAHTKEVVEACCTLGVHAESIAAEFGDLNELGEMLEKLERLFPAIDIVFNNAAISLPCDTDLWNISPQNYLTHYTINTVAPIRICYRLIPAMMRRGFGRVINISSTIQKRPSEMAYACSKAALSKFVHDLAPSLEGTGVMISLVCPGHVSSDMGGINAPNSVESVIPGALLGAVMYDDINGRYFIAQDYAGLSLSAAVERAKFYYSQEV